MSEQDLELEAFSKFIVALEPWLGEAVVVGGWAHRADDPGWRCCRTAETQGAGLNRAATLSPVRSVTYVSGPDH
jgi:hypothetical protein